MKNLAKREEEKQIRNIKLTAGKWFHIEAESLPESSLPKLITGMIIVRIIRNSINSKGMVALISKLFFGSTSLIDFNVQLAMPK